MEASSRLRYAVGLACYAFDRVLCRDEQRGYQPGYHWLWHCFSAFAGLRLLHCLPPEDWKQPGHDIDPWCGCLATDAVPELRARRWPCPGAPTKVAPIDL